MAYQETLKKAIAKAETMTSGNIYINLGIKRTVATRRVEKDGQKRTYIRIDCYTLNGRYKGNYKLGYVDEVTGEYVFDSTAEFDLEIIAE